jgi:DNA-binding MarR family transcriptional regulator
MGLELGDDRQRPSTRPAGQGRLPRRMREMNAALADLGLTAPQAEALAVLAQAGPLSLNQLGGLLIAEGGHPSRLVDRLVQAGWVARQEAADDRRRVTLRLTAAGEQLHAQAVQRTAPVFAGWPSGSTVRMSPPPALCWPPASAAPTLPRSSAGVWPPPLSSARPPPRRPRKRALNWRRRERLPRPLRSEPTCINDG